MEFVTVIILLIGAAASIYEKIQEKKRQGEQGPGGDGQPDPASRPALPTALEQWQQELKRVLEEKQARRPPVQAPPVQAPPPATAKKQVIIPTLVEPAEERSSIPSILAGAREAQARAAAIQKAGEVHLPGLPQRTGRTGAAVAIYSHAAPNRQIVQDIVKDRHSLKRAVLASVILGPPRSSEL